MRFSYSLLGGALLLLPLAASAKIYPQDFMYMNAPMQQPATTNTAPVTVDEAPTSEQPFYYVAPLQDGMLTRAEFAEAIATRIYPASSHDACFEELVGGPVTFTNLFKDVTIESTYASSLCTGMRTGLIHGYADGNYRPNKPVSAAEVAYTLARMTMTVYPGTPWYKNSMDAMRSVDREFTMNPGDTVTGKQLKHIICTLNERAPMDPLGEFANDCE